MPLVPDIATAERSLTEAEKQNPGLWANHSRYVAEACRIIAAHCPGLNADKAYTLGLLHDIGRYIGRVSERHLIAGYRYCKEQGWDKAAQICITHSFMIQDINTSTGRWDVTDEEYNEIRNIIQNSVYDDYDRLVQLGDALALPSGFCLLEKRFVDVVCRYGMNENYPIRWEKLFEIKQLFDKKTGGSVYRLLPGIVENTFS